MSEIIIDRDEARRDLAAIFRWTARENMHEGVANHFSYAISDDGQRFLMNPAPAFLEMQASDLIEIDAAHYPSELVCRIDPTAWAIHSAMHRNNPQARCIVHLHTHYATALSALKSHHCQPLTRQVAGSITALPSIRGLVAWVWVKRLNVCRICWVTR